MHGLAGLYVHVTRRCTLACAYCYGDCSPASSGDLDEEAAELLAAEVVRLRPRQLTLTGGEPLLHPGLLRMARTLRAACDEAACALRLATNGALLDVERAALCAALFDEVRVSLDGRAEINDALRGAGAYDSATAAIRRLQGAGFAPSVAVTASQLSLPELPAFLGFVQRELGVARVHVSPLRPAGRACGRPDLACSWREVRAAIRSYWTQTFGPSATAVAEDDDAGTLRECTRCGIGAYLSISADGGVYPCHVLTRPGCRLGTLADGLGAAALRAAALGEALSQRVAAALAAPELLPAEVRVALGDALCTGELLPYFGALNCTCSVAGSFVPEACASTSSLPLRTTAARCHTSE